MYEWCTCNQICFMAATVSWDPIWGHRVSGVKNPHLWSKSWITYPQLWVVEIHTAPKHQLCHKALSQMPGPGDGHCQVVWDVSMYSTEGRWEVSAVGQNEWQYTFRQNSTNSCSWNSISWPSRKTSAVKTTWKKGREREIYEDSTASCANCTVYKVYSPFYTWL